MTEKPGNISGTLALMKRDKERWDNEVRDAREKVPHDYLSTQVPFSAAKSPILSTALIC